MKESTYWAEMQTTGRLGVPKSIRDGLGLKAGDSVIITIRKVEEIPKLTKKVTESG